MTTFYSLVCLVALSFGMPKVSNCTPNSPNDYTDYLPKYRSQNKNFILTKIDYTSDKMILYFKCVANRDGEIIRFSGASTATAWKLYVSSRGTTGLTKLASIKNVKINNKLKAEQIATDNEAEFSAQEGQIVEGEAHFSKLPTSIRTINFSGGEIGICNDILIKDNGSPMLGNESQMGASIDRFYNMLSNFGVNVVRTTAPTEEKKMAGIDFGKKESPQPTKKETAITKAAKPVSYTPKELSSAKDMGCNTRVILKNVYFADNSAEYAGRVEALKTIQIIIDYLIFYPQATIVLHGHTDVFGDGAKNMELSRSRVLTVKRTLIRNGIDSDRVSLLHHGSVQPLPNYAKGGVKNRRVEVEVICE